MMSSALLALLTACTPPGPCDSGSPCDSGGDSGTGLLTQSVYRGPVTLDQLYWSCTDSPTESFSYELYTLGWTSSVTLEIVLLGDTTPWAESHTLATVSYDPNRWWERSARDLTVLDGSVCHRNDVEGSPDAPDCQSVWETNTNTWFRCSDRFTEQSMTWAVTIADIDGNDVGCWTWGVDDTAFPECQPFEP